MSGVFAFSVGRVGEELRGSPRRVRVASWNAETQQVLLEWTAEYLANGKMSESQSYGSDPQTFEYGIDEAGRQVTVVRASDGNELHRTIETFDASGRVVEAECDGARATWSQDSARLRFPDGLETIIKRLTDDQMEISAPDGTTICVEVPKAMDEVQARDEFGNWTRKMTPRGLLLRTIEYWS